MWKLRFAMWSPSVLIGTNVCSLMSGIAIHTNDYDLLIRALSIVCIAMTPPILVESSVAIVHIWRKLRSK